MLRLSVIVLVAFNIIMAGLWMAQRHPEPYTETAPGRPAADGLPIIELMGEPEPSLAGQRERLRCYSLGPFETEPAMRQARGLLAPVAMEITERTTTALMELGYWVELESLEDLGGAADAVRALRQNGLEDVAVVTAADGSPRVSLGYFLQERYARARRDQARKLGFAAAIRLQRETQPRFWLDYVQDRDAPPAPQALGRAVAASLHRPIPCSEVILPVTGEAEPPAGP